MKHSHPRSLARTVAKGTLAILLSASLAGCVTNEELGNPEGWEEILPAKNPQLAALVPPDVQAKGKIHRRHQPALRTQRV